MNRRRTILYGIVIVLMVVLVARLFQLQVLDPQYKRSASNNVLRYEIQYPTRGEVYDRNGEFLVQSKEVYDLMVTPREVRAFDTMLMCSIIGVGKDELVKALDKARRYSPRQASMVFEMLPKEVKLKLDERGFAGFHSIYRNIRSYPRSVGGNLLGYVGRTTDRDLAADKFYRSADYIGRSGVERAYEDVLRGKKGVKVNMVDVHGVAQGSFAGGIYDTMPVQGTAITTTIDLRLQALGEELLAGKVGSAVAIEPSTGELLMMVSSPSYDPEKMVGRGIGENYAALLNDPRLPLINRAVQSHYSPGSTFKTVVGLIGLQEGVLTPQRTYPCNGGYPYGRGVKCHAHPSPLDFISAIQTSCNAYFCYVLRATLDNQKKYPGGVKDGFAAWEKYVRSFGFGRKLNSDFLDELAGKVPSVATYDLEYHGQWNSMTVLTLSIGQDKMLASPLQLANLAAIIANRGHYYIPHIVKRIHDRDSIDARFYERHTTDVESQHFDPVVEGMWRAVNQPGGTGYWHRIDGLDMCGKTGTAENSHGKDHSTFMCFAPRDNPRIAVSVYVENGGFGATIAAPVASLIVEQYLTDTIQRPWLVEQIKGMTINYPYYDKKR